MKQYHDFLKQILDNGTKKEDRTGTGTISYFGTPQMEFDLSKGFPAVTTKKLFLKGVIAELLMFLSSSPDRRALHDNFDEKAFDIWKGNTVDRKDGVRFNGLNIGNLYPVYWRKLPIAKPTDYVYIEKKEYKDEDYSVSHPDIEFREYYRSGEEVETKSNGTYVILGKSKTSDYVVLRFKDTGYIIETAKPTKNVKDRLKANVQGHGYFGYGDMDKTSQTYKHLFRKWQDMLIRCYNPRENHANYEDVRISKRWHNFTEFYNDAFSLPGFQEFVDSGYAYQIDKDYYGSRIYSKESCIFINPKLNKSLNAGSSGKFRIYNFDNKSFYSKTSLEEYMYGSRLRKTDKDYIENGVEILKDTDTHIVRPKIFIDQIANIIDGIKSNPDSRRLVINSWNPESDRNAVLSACHSQFQFYIANGKLDCKLYQRSADAFLGVPYNIASYALLTMMIAQVCDLEPGRFIHTFGDAHIYSNHMEQVKEQLSREPYDLPIMKINPSIKNIDDFKMEDFELADYKSHPTIKAEMAV